MRLGGIASKEFFGSQIKTLIKRQKKSKEGIDMNKKIIAVAFSLFFSAVGFASASERAGEIEMGTRAVDPRSSDPAAAGVSVQAGAAEGIVQAIEDRHGEINPALRPCVLASVAAVVAGVGVGAGIGIERTVKTVAVRSNVTVDCFHPQPVTPHDPPFFFVDDLIDYNPYFTFPLNTQGQVEIKDIPPFSCVENINEQDFFDRAECELNAGEFCFNPLLGVKMSSRYAFANNIFLVGQGCGETEPAVFLNIEKFIIWLHKGELN